MYCALSPWQPFGGSFLFQRMAAPEFGPIPLVELRLAVGALLLLPLVLFRADWRTEIVQHRRKIFILGLINAALPFPLFAYLTLFVTAGFASIINATAPLFAALLAGLWLRNPTSGRGWLGLIIGFGGVLVLVETLPRLNQAEFLAVVGGLLASFFMVSRPVLCRSICLR